MNETKTETESTETKTETKTEPNPLFQRFYEACTAQDMNHIKDLMNEIRSCDVRYFLDPFGLRLDQKVYEDISVRIPEQLCGLLLMEALRTGNIRALDFLYKNFTQEISKSTFWKEPLHMAAVVGCHELVKNLIDSGAHVDDLDHELTTPLQRAAWRSNLSTVKVLLGCGADPNYCKGSHFDALSSVTGRTEKASATKKRDLDFRSVEIVKLLLLAGADAKKTQWAIVHAVEGGNTEIVQILLDAGADVNAVGFTHYSVLHEAAKRNHLDTMRCLINRGANVNGCGPGDSTPLYEATLAGHPQAIALLTENGADIYTKHKQGCTALSITLRGTSPHSNFVCYDRKLSQKIVKELMVAAIDAEDVAKAFDIGYEAVVPCEETLMILLAAGLDTESEAFRGLSPLHQPFTLLSYACRDGKAHAVRVLLAAGAKVNHVDSERKTPMTYANNNNRKDIQLLLTAVHDKQPITRAANQFSLSELEDARYQIKLTHQRLLQTKAEFNKARERWCFRRMIARATEICIALEGLSLPALMTVMILDEACAPHAELARFGTKWALVVTVKHPKFVF